MQSISFPATVTSPLFRPRLPTKSKAARLIPVPVKKNTNGSDFGSGFGLVDESMIVLRRRIHEMEVAERNYEAPSHWTDWEKRYYTSYGSDVCSFVGLVQTVLMKTRPGLAIGLLGLIGLSVPVSALLVWIQLMEAATLSPTAGLH